MVEDSAVNAKEVIRSSFGRAQMVTAMLIGDLSDAEIMQRPVANANHIAWQLGHLIASVHYFGESIKAGSMPALPDGFDARHSKETAHSDDPAAFLSKDAYAGLLDQQRAALLRLVEQTDDATLAADSSGDLKEIAPRLIDVVALAAEHEMMHSGQISVLRRKLGKPVTF
jgi:uncharacterized damage-inducible protein DinB